MKSILITGCNRGLGLGLVKTITKLPNPPKHIFATCRNIEQAKELTNLAAQYTNLHLLQVDLKDFDKYENLVKEVESIVKEDGLNVLFNNAGIAFKSTRLNFTKADELIESFTLNTIAPIMLTKAFYPLLKTAAQVNSTSSMGVAKATIINMSSILGSIALNTDGGMYSYRTSKTALNSATKSMSVDLKHNQILAISLHPGWVKTDMGGPKAPLDVETSTKGITETLFKLNESHNGCLVNYDGSVLPW